MNIVIVYDASPVGLDVLSLVTLLVELAEVLFSEVDHSDSLDDNILPTIEISAGMSSEKLYDRCLS